MNKVTNVLKLKNSSLYNNILCSSFSTKSRNVVVVDGVRIPFTLAGFYHYTDLRDH